MLLSRHTGFNDIGHALMCSIRLSHTKGLFTPWTMKSSQGLLKYVTGCWTRPKTTLVYTKQKCHSDNGIWGPQQYLFEGLTNSVGPCCYNILWFFIFYFYFFISSFSLFEHILRKSAQSFFGAWHYSWSTFGLHLVRGPKVL